MSSGGVGDVGLKKLAFIFAFLFTAGCGGFEIYGTADNYARFIDYEIDVVMPPNAPFISEQYRKGSETGTDAHLGMDVWAKIRTPILAAADGVVISSYYEPAYGHRVEIDHGLDARGLYHETVYMHLKERMVNEGERVVRGQQIGQMGATGAMGMFVHLHFEVHEGRDRRSAKAKDPQLYWVKGVGRVTCFEPDLEIPQDRFRTTYPVVCR